VSVSVQVVGSPSLVCHHEVGLLWREIVDQSASYEHLPPQIAVVLLGDTLDAEAIQRQVLCITFILA
jgi:hypothetical protein